MNLNQQPPERAIKASDSIEIHSIFNTIQGEGPYAGCRAIFVRLAGCNLQCPMCDTEYTKGRMPYTPATLLAEIVNLTYPIPELIVITGGEPLRQPIRPFVEALLVAGFKVQVETNGTLYQDLPFEHPRFMIICSPKMHYVHPKLIDHIRALKYVANVESLKGSPDGLPMKALDHPLQNKILFRPPPYWPGEVYLQPVDEQDEAKNLHNQHVVVRSCQQYGHRLCLQLHKIIGVS